MTTIKERAKFFILKFPDECHTTENFRAMEKELENQAMISKEEIVNDFLKAMKSNKEEDG